jgi:hypothetical protein
MLCKIIIAYTQIHTYIDTCMYVRTYVHSDVRLVQEQYTTQKN